MSKKRNRKPPQKKVSPALEVRFKRRCDAVAAVQHSESVETVARVFGIGVSTLFQWLARYRQGGWDALRDGSRSGRKKKLTAAIIKWLYDAITMKDPMQFQFDFCLWTLEIIRNIIRKTFNISISKASISRLMRQIGLSAQRPVFKAVQQNPQEVDKYLKERYPEIRARAKRNGAEIFFIDEAAFRSDHHSGTTWAPIGETPIIPEHRGRFGAKSISAISAKGKMYFRIFEGSMNKEGFIDFLKKLRRDVGKPIIVIADCASYHKANAVKEYVAETQGNVGLELLPVRSPELNPDEQVWNQAKKSLGKMIIQNKADMKKCVSKVLRSIQRRANLIIAFFQLPDTKYAGMDLC